MFEEIFKHGAEILYVFFVEIPSLRFRVKPFSAARFFYNFLQKKVKENSLCSSDDVRAEGQVRGREGV